MHSTEILNKVNNKEIIHVCLSHRDKFFQQYGLSMQSGQKKISDSIIRNVLFKTGKEIGAELSRQSGKTTIMCWTAVFLLLYIQKYWKILNYSNRGVFEMGWFAPQVQQAKTGFDRMKDILERTKITYDFDYDESNGNTLKLSLGDNFKSIIYVFPLSPTSNIESKTMDFAIFDESQKLSDRELLNKAFPMLANTNGVKCFIGTAGWNICYFYELLNRSERQNVEVFIYNAYSIIEQKEELYKITKDDNYLNYRKHFENEVLEHGLTSDYIKTQYLLEWNLEKGMFISPNKMMKVCVPLPVVKEDKVNLVNVCIDCAKESDSTVAVAWRWEEYKREEWLEPKLCVRVLDWFVLNHELYADQWEILQEEFLNNYNINKINIDGTGPGDGTGDWFLKKYDNVNYDKFKMREANGRRGIVRPIKFTSQSKNKMFKELQKYIDNDMLLVPIDNDGIGYNKFVMESRILLKEYKGDLLSVHHSDLEGATDDCWDALAMGFYDLDLEPINKQGLKVVKFQKEFDIHTPTQRAITEKWLNKRLRRINKI